MIHHTFTLCSLWLLFTLSTLAQPLPKGIKIIAGGKAPAGTERRVAIILANQNYEVNGLDLQKCYNDAEAMKTALDGLGFEVLVFQKDLTRVALDRLLLSLTPKLKGYDVAFFYYSGHGAEYEGKNYILPTDMPLPEFRSDVATYGLSIDRVYRTLADGGIKTSLLALDACRSVLTGKSGGLPTGLILPTNNPDGTFTMFATRSGNIAQENPAGQHGYFTQELLKNIVKPDYTITKIFFETRRGVKAATSNQQDPSSANELDDDFVFVQTSPEAPKPTRTKPTTRKFLDLPFADMAFVEGGTFQMGDTRDEGNSDEKPVHTVTVSSFLMGKYEVTQQQWESIMGSNPSEFKDCPDCPVEQVSWGDVQVFLEKLNARTGGHYRLPTEAEWEYAAGGGNTPNRTRFGNGQNVLDPAQANFDGNAAHKQSYSVDGVYRRKTVKVGSFSPNGLGLYDLSGNVWEWCSDWFGAYSSGVQTDPAGPPSGPFRVFRGGSWIFYSEYCRSAARYFHTTFTTTYQGSYIGFRIVSPAP